MKHLVVSIEEIKAEISRYKAMIAVAETNGIVSTGHEYFRMQGFIGVYENLLATCDQIEYVKDEVVVVKEDKPVEIGTLNKPYGLNGYIRAEVGHPVYEHKDRYIIYLDHLTQRMLPVTFYKESLKTSIDFN